MGKRKGGRAKGEVRKGLGVRGTCRIAVPGGGKDEAPLRPSMQRYDKTERKKISNCFAAGRQKKKSLGKHSQCGGKIN